MRRFTFEIGEDGDSGLEQIRIDTGTSSKSEVLRDALALYEILVERAKKGNSLFIGRDRDSAIELVMPSLSRATKQRR